MFRCACSLLRGLCCLNCLSGLSCEHKCLIREAAYTLMLTFATTTLASTRTKRTNKITPTSQQTKPQAVQLGFENAVRCMCVIRVCDLLLDRFYRIRASERVDQFRERSDWLFCPKHRRNRCDVAYKMNSKTMRQVATSSSSSLLLMFVALKRSAVRLWRKSAIL